MKFREYTQGAALTGSHLLREMWIEMEFITAKAEAALSSHLLREMWIEIALSGLRVCITNRVISCGRCGLK